MAAVNRHDNFLKAGVTCSFTNSVDRALNLICTSHHTCQRVSDGKSQIVVTVNTDELDFVDVGHSFNNCANELTELMGQSITDGVGDVNGRCAGINGGFKNLAKEIWLASRCIFGAELNIVGVIPRPLDSVYRRLNDLLAGHPEFVLHVDIAGRYESVDSSLFGWLEGFPCNINVLLDSPC